MYSSIRRRMVLTRTLETASKTQCLTTYVLGVFGRCLFIYLLIYLRHVLPFVCVWLCGALWICRHLLAVPVYCSWLLACWVLTVTLFWLRTHINITGPRFAIWVFMHLLHACACILYISVSVTLSQMKGGLFSLLDWIDGILTLTLRVTRKEVNVAS